MTLEEKLALEARIYVAMAEIDYDLKSWHQWFYSPSRSISRSGVDVGFRFRLALKRAQLQMEALSAAWRRQDLG